MPRAVMSAADSFDPILTDEEIRFCRENARDMPAARAVLHALDMFGTDRTHPIIGAAVTALRQVRPRPRFIYTEMYAFIGVLPKTGDEMLMGYLDKKTGMQVFMVGGDMEHMRGMMGAVTQARRQGHKVKLMRFSNAEVIDERIMAMDVKGHSS